MEVIRDYDALEALAGQRPGAAVLQVRLYETRPGDLLRLSIDRDEPLVVARMCTLRNHEIVALRDSLGQ